jgi:hypothetical protein
VGQERLGPSYFFIPLVLGPLNSLVWWEVPLWYSFGLIFVSARTNKRHHHQTISSIKSDISSNLSKINDISSNTMSSLKSDISLNLSKINYISSNTMSSLKVVISSCLVLNGEARKRKNLQFALHAHACSLRCTLGAIRSGTRYAKWAGGSRSQTHRRAAMGGFTQDDGYVRGVAPTHDCSSGSFSNC